MTSVTCQERMNRVNTSQSTGTVDAQPRPLSFAHWLSEACRHGTARRHCNYCLTDALSTVSMDLTFARFIEIVEPQS